MKVLTNSKYIRPFVFFLAFLLAMLVFGKRVYSGHDILPTQVILAISVCVSAGIMYLTNSYAYKKIQFTFFVLLN